MSLATDIRQAALFARRDLRGSTAGLRLLFLCLFLGVAALAGIGSLSATILGGLSERGQIILGGDLQFQTSQREADAIELTALRKLGPVSTTIRMRAMAARTDGGEAVLAEFKGVDSAYPLYGALRLAPGALAAHPHGLDIAIAPALAERLRVAPGDKVRIGDVKFRVIGIIFDEPDRTSEGFTLGPVVLADIAGVAVSHLVQPGSLYTMRYRVKTAPTLNLDLAAKQFIDAFPSGGWGVTNRTNAAPSTRRFITQLAQFLALVGLTALIIAGIGVGNGVTSWLADKRGAIAIFKVLGADARMIFMIYFWQIFITACVAIIAALIAGGLLPWAIVAVAGNQLPVVPKLTFYAEPLMLAALDGLIIATLFVLPGLARAQSITPATLFRNRVEPSRWPRWRLILVMIIGGAGLATLAIGSANDPRFAAIFIAAALALFAFLFGIGSAVTWIAAHVPKPRAPLLRLALSNLHRPGAQTNQLVVALGLGLTLFVTLAVMQTSLAAQIATTIPQRAPNFFALDIAKGDEARFRATVKSVASHADITTVPMLRGPITALGDKRVANMKDIPEAAWFLHGDRGLTFAADLAGGSEIMAGQWWPKNYTGPPLVSLDERAAKAVGLKVGDRITVSVLGVEIEARIASLRKINWDTLGFNFVLIFSPGSLDAAPYTFAATITSPAAAEPSINRAVAAAFPSVSLIKIKDLILQVSTLLGQLSSAIGIAASVAVVTGTAVLFGAIAAAQNARRYDAVLLKLLGATRSQILLVQALEYALLSIIVALLALAIGCAAGWSVLSLVLDLKCSPDWQIVFGTAALGALGTWLFGVVGTLPILRARPAAALRSL